MALSNWDTFAVDQDGKSMGGAFTSPLGVVVEFYKNCLYVRDGKAWEEGGSFCSPTVMEIKFGEVRYKDVFIVAVRGPQDGVYAVVASDYYDDKKFRAMVGVGCYGYSGEYWVGVKDDSIAHLRAMLDEGSQHEYIVGDDKHVYVDHTFPERIRKISLTGGLRFNQGDAFFAENLGTPLGATSPGEAREPVVMKLIDAMSGKTSEKKKEK